ncbi:MAG: imidazole glycerol phosphate synthase subunit HisH [Syntrophobacteria bacterium]
MIAIVDYRAGNLASVARALEYLGESWVITHESRTLREAERIIFPGVGAAGEAMANLRELGLDEIIRDLYERGVPFLGICLGTQIILEHSEEDDTRCLGLLPGITRAFPRSLCHGRHLKVPHMGWNQVSVKQNSHPLMAGIEPESEFYFVHSYYPDPAESRQVQGWTDYGVSFPSFVGCANLAAVQFHPEKSGKPGLRFLENFCRWQP